MKLNESFIAIFLRDLELLKKEIESYKEEKNIWRIDNGISNSGGNLCLHLIGNLNTYIGAGLGKTGYIRNRELEFSLKDIPRTELQQKIEDTIIVVEQSLKNITAEQMAEDFPLLIWDKPMTAEYTLIRLAAHLSYHLGQINYHRRLLDTP
jgi:hypothetical protein